MTAPLVQDSSEAIERSKAASETEDLVPRNTGHSNQRMFHVVFQAEVESPHTLSYPPAITFRVTFLSQE